MERIIFFIYTIIRSDERYEATSKAPVYITVVLLSFFDLFFFTPVIHYLNGILLIVNVKAFLSLPIPLRYLIIAVPLSLISLVNYYVFFRGNKLELIVEKFEHKKDKYLRNKWLLLVFAVVLGVISLAAGRLLYYFNHNV